MTRVVEATRRDAGAEERRYRKLIENIRDTVTVVDASGTTIWTSASQRGDLGYRDEFWSGANLFDLVHPDDRAEIDDGLLRLLSEPTTIANGEVRLREPDGSYRHVGYHAINRLSDVDIGGIVITAHPIEHEVRLRSEREERRIELERTLAGRARFIADLSHEMRSPLHAIVGLAELIEGSDELPPKLERHVRSISKESHALRVMLDEFLDFSKLSANRLELLTEPFSPGAVVDAVAESQSPVARSKGLDFHVEIATSVPLVVLGDEHRLRQVLVNLVSNAIKYTDAGHVKVGVSQPESGELEFRVTDTGPGIPEESWPGLFEPYHQARQQDTTKGTGLGLVITKRLVELMGGALNFETSGQGTSFRAAIAFPEARRKSDVAVAQPLQQRDEVEGSALDVLIVDDSEVNLMLAHSQLEKLGHTPTMVTSGASAIELLASRQFDLVLMDWHMPHMDGLETTRRIRANEPDSNRIPIIATTASVMAGDRETCLAAGMDDYLPKPISLSDLGAMVARWSPDATAAGLEPEPAINGLEGLINELGDPEIVSSVIGAFLAEIPGWRESLTSGIESGDFDRARRAAHTLKSTAQLLGATELSTQGAQFEATDEPAQLVEQLPTLVAALDAAKARLQTVQSELAVEAGREATGPDTEERKTP